METQLRMQQEQLLLKQREEQLKAMQRQIEVCAVLSIKLSSDYRTNLDNLVSVA